MTYPRQALLLHLEGVLFDNETAQAVSAMLPLTVDLWHPAPGFARAFDLPEQIPDTAERTRNYERGGLAYWYEGPSVAIFYSDHLEQTRMCWISSSVR